MKKIVLIALLMGAFCSVSLAQGDIDALRYSTTNPLGSSARSMGVGGALGALGADPSVVLINPASLAQYKSNAFNITLGMDMMKNKASYLEGSPYVSNSYKAELPSFNLVFTDRKYTSKGPKKTGWVNYNFAMGYNKTADFTRRMSYSGVNTQTSMLDYVSDYVRGLPASALDANDEQLSQGFYYFENMFWYAYLIDSVQDGVYAPTRDMAMTNQQQNGSIVSKGSMGEINFNFAANYSHKLYLGFGVNIHQVHYDETNVFSEIDNPLTTGTWNSFDFTRNLETRGVGYSGRLGMVLRPNNHFRVGASLQTPTVFNLTDNYYDELYVVYDDGSTEDLSTLDKEYSYSIVSPMRYGLQAAYIVGKTGFISAEIEGVDYSTMNLFADDHDFGDVNQQIANKYQNVVNIKLGGEYAIDEFRLRAGYAQMGVPFAQASNFNRRFITGGLGLQEDSWAFDLAVVKTFGSEQYVPYSGSSFTAPTVNSDLNGTRIVLTLSTRF